MEENYIFEGNKYYDNRLFVLYLCPGKVEIENGDGGAVWTSIYHENPPEDHIWCVVTYKNYGRYPLSRIDSFYNKQDAISYIRQIEPETPLISLGGKSPQIPMEYDKYTEWKESNALKGYNWKLLFSPDGKNAGERVGQTKSQFKGIK